MELLILLAMGFELLLSCPLILVGGAALRKGPEDAEPPGGWPAVSMVVPVGDLTPNTRPAMESLLSQDYPDLEVIFAAHDEDPAVQTLVAGLIEGRSKAKLILAGRSESCSQKNHNLLAGVREVRSSAKVLAFCDSSHIAPVGFVKALVSPIAHRKARVTSGYHHVEVTDAGLLLAVRAVTVLTLYLTKAFGFLNQPWGGATAIERKLFQDLDVSGLWASTVVDDVTLAGRLAKARIRTALSSGAWVSTRVGHDTLAGFQEWLTRQWLFLKFVFPLGWLVAGLHQYWLSALTLYALLAIPGLPLGWVSFSQGVAALVFMMAGSFIALCLRRLHPSPGPPSLWVAATILSGFMGSWIHMRTLWGWRLRWQGVTYWVGLGARVKRVERE